MSFKILYVSIRTRHTCCTRNWNSHVCSSDLVPIDLLGMYAAVTECWFSSSGGKDWLVVPGADTKPAYRCEIGRASCRERGKLSADAVSSTKDDKRRHRCGCGHGSAEGGRAFL